MPFERGADKDTDSGDEQNGFERSGFGSYRRIEKVYRVIAYSDH